jgi:hypothetical protein
MPPRLAAAQWAPNAVTKPAAWSGSSRARPGAAAGGRGATSLRSRIPPLPGPPPKPAAERSLKRG